MPVKIFIAFVISVFFFGSTVLAQQSSPSSIKIPGSGLSKKFFFYWGYNGAVFSHSDIHFSAPTYDFTLFNAGAQDRPSPFSFKLYFSPTTFTIPQYNYRVGYYINDRFSISFGEDHMKYVIDSNQRTTISGVISAEASEKYAGEYLGTPVTLTTDFVKFEHTDGLNLLSLDLEYTLPIVDFFQSKLRIELNAGGGVAMMIPRTDVRVFGYGLNNNYHLAGYAVNAKVGPQIRFFDHYFVRAQARTGYIVLPNILIHNGAPDRAEQDFSFLEYYVAAGILFPFGRNSK